MGIFLQVFLAVVFTSQVFGSLKFPFEDTIPPRPEQEKGLVVDSIEVKKYEDHTPKVFKPEIPISQLHKNKRSVHEDLLLMPVSGKSGVFKTEKGEEVRLVSADFPKAPRPSRILLDKYLRSKNGELEPWEITWIQMYNQWIIAQLSNPQNSQEIPIKDRSDDCLGEEIHADFSKVPTPSKKPLPLYSRINLNSVTKGGLSGLEGVMLYKKYHQNSQGSPTIQRSDECTGFSGNQKRRVWIGRNPTSNVYKRSYLVGGRNEEWEDYWIALYYQWLSTQNLDSNEHDRRYYITPADYLSSASQQNGYSLWDNTKRSLIEDKGPIFRWD